MRTEPNRTLVLLRHAKSAWPDDVPDHDRPLAGRGRRDAPGAGRWLRRADRVPDLVLCSTAARARETWLLAEGELGARPPVSYEPGVYRASADSLLRLIRGVPATVRTVLVVGHDPALAELALALAGTPGGRDHPAADFTGPADPADSTALGRLRTKFPTAAIAVLTVGGPWAGLAAGGAGLISFVTPRDLRGR